MKIYIDKGHGLHYHKPDCTIVFPTTHGGNYEEVEHIVRKLGMSYHKEYVSIKIDGRLYRPCPFCFGYDRR